MIWMLGCLIISTFINHGVGFRFDKCDSIANTRVFNGNTAEKHSWPWLVSIQRWGGRSIYHLSFPEGPWTHICGGSIISERIVISAAHCFPDKPEKPWECCWDDWQKQNYTAAEIRIVPGLHIANLSSINENLSEWGAPNHEIHKIYLPSDWNSTTQYHDLAILIMKTPFTFNEKIQPITLDFRPEYMNTLKVKGSCCKLAGWGRIEDGSIPDELQEVGVPIVDLITCANSHIKDCLEVKAHRDPMHKCPLVTSDHFCAAGKDGRDSCMGDSGGPVVCNYHRKGNFLTGVVSYGPYGECGLSNVPGVYTKISSFESIIKPILKDSPNFDLILTLKEYDGLKSMIL